MAKQRTIDMLKSRVIIKDYSKDAERTALVSGENLAHMFGKIARWYTDISWVGHKHVVADITDFPVLGTAASKDVPASGDAGNDEVVMGNDSRLTDARTPTSHTHSVSEITDFPTLGTAAEYNVPSSGDASNNEVVLGNDSRLSDARTPLSHTHTEADITNLGTYAGASTKGGAATSANKLNIGNSDIGNSTTPVYFDSETGLPIALSYTIEKSVPADAVFTDTTYSTMGPSGSSHAGGLVPDTPSTAGTSKYLREDGTWAVPPNSEYVHPSYTPYSSGLYKITVDTLGHVSAASAVTGADLPSHSHTVSDITNFPTLGTAAGYDVPATGDADDDEVVLGNDSRLSDARTPLSHTHTEADISDLGTYAGSSTKGGAATSANKLNIGSSDIGSETKPVYFNASSGKPVACAYSLNASVPANAVFTDINVKQSPSTANESREVLFAGNTGNTETVGTTGKSNKLYFNPSTGALTATSFSGSVDASNLTGSIDAARLPNSGVTANSYGPAAGGTLTYGGTFDVPYVTVDKYGRLTAASTKTFTMPAQYTHPSYTSKTSGLYKITVDSLGHVSATAAVTASDLPSHSHTLNMASSTGSSSITLAANTKYQLTAGGSTYIFTTPTDTVYTHPTYTEKTNGLYKITVDSLGHVSATAAVTASDLPSHTHPYLPDTTKYAGSSSVGGAATSANKLNIGSSNIGNSTTPVYFDSTTGLPVVLNYTIAKSVPADAKFTDTVYTHPTYTAKASGVYKITVTSEGHVSAATAATAADIGAMNKKASCVNGANYNDFNTTGFFEALGNSDYPTENAPDGNNTNNNFYVIVQQRAASYFTQIATSVRSDKSMYIRSYTNSTWSDWVEMKYTDENVSQTNTTTNANYRVLFSGTADDTDRTEIARKSLYMRYNPNTYRLFLRGSTSASVSYGATNPAIRFENSNASQNIELVFSDYDTLIAPASLALIGNQGNESFLAPKIRAWDFTNNKTSAMMECNTVGTTSTTGLGKIIAGNNIASGTAGNASGSVTIYGASTYCVDLRATTLTGNRTIYFPDIAGTMTGIIYKATDYYALASHTHDYLPLTGGTLTGALTIKTNAYEKFSLYRSGSSNGAAIHFYNDYTSSAKTCLGSICMTGAPNTGLKRVSADGATTYSIWDSGNFSLSLAASTGTSQITLANDGKYQINAGGKSYVFTMPPAGAHPSGPGYYHIPTGGSSGQVLIYGGSSGTATWFSSPISAYGVCETAADVAAKVVTITNGSKFILTPGAVVSILYSYTNTANNPTLNVNGTGDIPVKYGTSVVTTSNLSYAAYANRVHTFMYDGTNYLYLSHNVDNNTTYSNRDPAQGGTQTSLVTTGDKYNWNSKADGNHVHSLSLTANSGTSAITLAASTKYQLTAGGSTLIFTTPPNTNTTYTIATGDSNGQIKVTPSSGSAYNVSVKGLGSAAYTSSSDYAPASHSHDYLPLSGGTMRGAITLVLDKYNVNEYGLDCNNSNIIGVNNIKFKDSPDDDASEGIHFYRTDSSWDSLWGKNGVLYFTPNHPTGTTNYTIYHSGNLTYSTIGAAAANHTHNYAGSSSAGGAATSANKLNTNAGSNISPVYFSGGVPVACKQAASGAYFSIVPYVRSDGVVEIGRYIDFHTTNTSTVVNYRIDQWTTESIEFNALGTNNRVNIYTPGSGYTRLSFQVADVVASGIIVKPLTSSGTLMQIECGGNMIIGSGESPSTLVSNSYDSIDTTETERLYLASDAEICFITSAQTYSERKEVILDTNGNFRIGPSQVIVQTQNSTSNYTELVNWWKGGTNPGNYGPSIGQHNTGDTDGSIIILPYHTTSNPWDAGVGLYVSKTRLLYNGTAISLNGHTHNYIPNTQAGLIAAINLLDTATAAPTDDSYYIAQENNASTTNYYRRKHSALWDYIKGKISSSTSGSGNAVTAVSYSGGAITVTKGSTFSVSTHTHGLLNSNLFVNAPNETTNTWVVIGANGTGHVLKSIRTQANAAPYLLGNYSAGIVFGGADTRGVISHSYGSPSVRFAGGNKTATDGGTAVWYFTVNATSGQTYTLPSTGGTLALSSHTHSNYLGAVNANSYWGMATPSGATNDWIRTTTQGIIPYQSGGAGSGHCGIGTSTWYFNYAYIDNIYGSLNGRASEASNCVCYYFSTDSYTTNVSYAMLFAADPTITEVNSLRKTDDIRVNYFLGAANTEGLVELVLGNATAKSSANNASGHLTLYNANGKYAEIFPGSNSANINLTLPSSTGTLALVGDNNHTHSYIPLSGSTAITGELVTTSANGYRLVYNKYGAIIRNDGSNWWFLITSQQSSDAAAKTASWANTSTLVNNSHPISIALSNGRVSINGYTLDKSVPSNAVFTDTNTTYTIGTGDSNGQIKVTPSSGSAYNVSVKGLGSAAYTNSSAYAAASHDHGRIVKNSTISYGASQLQWFDLSGNGTVSASTAYNPSNDWYHHIMLNHANSGGYYIDLAICFHADAFYYKRIVNGSIANASRNNGWVRILDQYNYASYITPNGIGAATSGHTHAYAGSTTVGGDALTSLSLRLTHDNEVNCSKPSASYSNIWLFYRWSDGATEDASGSKYIDSIYFGNGNGAGNNTSVGKFANLVFNNISQGTLRHGGASAAWWNDRNAAMIYQTDKTANYLPIWGCRTNSDGSWCCGNHNGDNLYFNFITKSVYDSGANPTYYRQIYFTSDAKIEARGYNIINDGSGRLLMDYSGITMYNSRSGGWADGIDMYNSQNTLVSAIGFYGVDNALQYTYIGGSYAIPLLKIEPSTAVTTISGTEPYLYIVSTNHTNSGIVLQRGSSSDTYTDYRIINLAGDFKIQSNVESDVHGDWFNMMTITYSTGDTAFKGSLQSGGHIIVPEGYSIKLRPTHSGYYAGIGYDTVGNECIAMWAKNTVTRLRWHAGIDMSSSTYNQMISLTNPDFEISKASGTPLGYIGGRQIVRSQLLFSGSTTITSGKEKTTITLTDTVSPFGFVAIRFYYSGNPAGYCETIVSSYNNNWMSGVFAVNPGGGAPGTYNACKTLGVYVNNSAQMTFNCDANLIIYNITGYCEG